MDPEKTRQCPKNSIPPLTEKRQYFEKGI